MNKFVRCLSLFLTLVFLFQVPCCLAAEYAEQDEEIKSAVEEYLARYARVVYNFETENLTAGTVTAAMTNTTRFSVDNDVTLSEAENFTNFMSAKADFFRDYRIANNIIRENCRYEYDYHSIMADDASASVKVSEYAFFNYAGDPVDSIRETVYDVELRKIDDCWFIYNVAEEGWFDGEFSNMTIDEMNDAVSQFLLTDTASDTQLTTSEESTTENLSSADNRIYYNKNNASAYAMTYTTGKSHTDTSFYNRNFSDWTGYGDCQNFASQCVWAGFYGNNSVTAISNNDLPMDTVGNADLSWYGSSTQWNETSTWRGCDMFRTYVLTSSENDDVGLYGDVYDISANSNVTGVSYTSLVGAVIQVEGYLNGVLTPYNHSVVVDAATSLNRNDIYCCAHSQIIKHNKLSEISLGSAKLIIPKYFRVEESTSNMLKGTLMPPQAQNTEKTIESFATGTQYKMTMRVFKPSGTYTTTTKYNCSRISMDKYEFTETGLYRIVTYAKPTSENDVANSHQFYIRVY